MNKHPIEEAIDRDLRMSMVAMHRAAKRAREIAAQTGTCLIVSRHGVIEKVSPHSTQADPCVQEPPADYGDKP